MRRIATLLVACLLLCGCEPECSLCSRSRHNVTLAIKTIEDLEADVKKWRDLAETWESINRFNHDSLTNCVATLEAVERDHKAEVKYQHTNSFQRSLIIVHLLKRLGTNEVVMTTNDLDITAHSNIYTRLEWDFPDDGTRRISYHEFTPLTLTNFLWITNK